MVYNVWFKDTLPHPDLKNLIGRTCDFLDSPGDLITRKARERYSLGNGIWHITSACGVSPLPVPSGLTLDDNISLIIEVGRAEPKIPDERNIMLQVLRKYLPHQGQDWDGWIPLELEDRVKRYPNAFVELFKYIPKDSQADIRKLLTDMNLTPLEN